jgi:hypothetical protein
MIPKIFHRTVPPGPIPEKYEKYWRTFQWLHPDWKFLTHFGGNIFMSDQVRLLALIHYGGIYVDWDIQPLRSWEPLLDYKGFAARDKGGIVMNGVMGAVPNHPAMEECLRLSIAVCAAGGSVQDAGCGVTEAILSNRDDWTLLPTHYFYPYDWQELERAGEDFSAIPDCYGVHHWATAWSKDCKAGQ